MGLLSLLIKDPVLFAVPAVLLLYSGSFSRAGMVASLAGSPYCHWQSSLRAIPLPRLP